MLRQASGVPMIASSPVQMPPDQNAAMLQAAASAVQIHHQFVQHAAATAMSSEPPALQPQPAVPPASVSWPAAAAQLVDYVGGGGVTSSSLSSLQVLDTDLDSVLPSTAAFQQLLDSFGCQSDVDDDDDDDDAVVNLDDSTSARHVTPSSRHHRKQRLQSCILTPQHHAVCSAARC